MIKVLILGFLLEIFFKWTEVCVTFFSPTGDSPAVEVSVEPVCYSWETQNPSYLWCHVRVSDALTHVLNIKWDCFLKLLWKL